MDKQDELLDSSVEESVEGVGNAQDDLLDVYREDDENVSVIDIRDAASRSYGDFAGYVIKDRGLPDLRDGLLPVQRRVLYGMHRMGNTHNKPTIKSARSVGEVMGKYHPHGDSSIYSALTRLTKDWLVLYPLVELQGNKGSIDGDNPASMRYTEARLSKMSTYLLEDLDKKEVIDWRKNFDDTLDEPVYLPAQYPNVLIAGVASIASGYASTIPPHNLKEVLESCIYLLDNPQAVYSDLPFKGPDFPTGGILINGKELERIYTAGSGSFKVRAKYHVEQESKRAKTKKIVFTEMPYGVKKPTIIEKGLDLLNSKQLNGVISIEDESGRDGIRLAVTVGRDVDVDVLTEILYQKTPLQSNSHLNLTVIDKGRPVRLGLIPVLKKFNNHRLGVIKRTLIADNNTDMKRLHILEGLFVLVNNTDAIIKLVKESDGKADAREKLMDLYNLDTLQANAILEMQVHRMSRVSMADYQGEYDSLTESVEARTILINDDELLKQYLIKQYEDIIEAEGKLLDRRTKVLDDVDEVDIKLDTLVQKEDVYVGVTEDGFIKRSTPRSYKATDTSNLSGFSIKTDTHHSVIVWGNKGNYVFYPVHELDEVKWGDTGTHISRLGSTFEDDELIIGLSEYDEDAYYFMLRDSMKGKLGLAKDLSTTRFRSSYSYGGVDDGELVIKAGLINIDTPVAIETTRYLKSKRETLCEHLVFKWDEVTPIGVKGKGRLFAKLGIYKELSDVYFVSNLEDDANYGIVGRSTGALDESVIPVIPNSMYNQDPQPYIKQELLVVDESVDSDEDVEDSDD